MKKKRKLKLIITVIIIIVIIIVGAYLIFHKEEKKEKKKGYPIKNIVNKDLGDEHCLDDFCLKNMTIAYYKDSISSIYAELINKSGEIKDICLKISFKTKGIEKTFDYSTCYLKADPNKENPIETYFGEEEKDVVFANSYQISYLTPEEKQEILSTKESE